jgi:hypothetical protein
VKAREWLEQFKKQVATADMKLWFLTSTGEWKQVEDEMPKGRLQIQIGFKYYDFYNTE